ncbi:MAG: phosphoribosylanthranilate isomerase [Muribaculum sp.]|nr:phosphoribosylanthranilate isomerase [Muribaculaceae bacterium]MCM1081443.1 phosphoribosylanthranilate isomerase [Muribaculum sp.]
MKYNPDSPTPHRERMIKICGNCNKDNIRQVSVLSPMMMGFIFSDRSPRNAMELDPAVVKSLPEFITPVGVFLNADHDVITDVCNLFGIKTVQLHGSESPQLCSRLRDEGYTVFKAIAIGNSLPVELLNSYSGSVDLFVFDTAGAKAGGNGVKFDWNLLEGYKLDIPYLIGGGVAPGDIDAIIGAMRPQMAGVDINSRFETQPGIKDIMLLTNFILNLRKFNEL